MKKYIIGANCGRQFLVEYNPTRALLGDMVVDHLVTEINHGQTFEGRWVFDEGYSEKKAVTFPFGVSYIELAGA